MKMMTTAGRLLTALVLALVIGAHQASSAGAAACHFQLGFLALHDLAPTEVGDCLEDEGHNPENGDGLQHTTNGLMAWRKADNWTAFTNGYWTWINGPYGLAKRLNTQRYPWEANPEGLPLVAAVPAVTGSGGQSASTGSVTSTTAHTYYASTYRTASTIYCDTDPGWRALSPRYLTSYPSLEAAMAALPGYHLHRPC